jgi:hypothetical protein
VNKILIVASLALVLMLGSCSSAEETELEYPFEVQYILGEGHTIGFSGDAVGHTPGGESEFLITLINDSSEPWNDRYFIQLVDETAVVKTLHEATISAAPGTSEIFPLALTLPSDLEPKVYGLAVFIPDRMAAITNIYVGVSYHQIPATTEWAEPEVPQG